MATKLPPHNIDAEESLLGSVLIDSDCYKLTSYIVKPESFYDERNQRIYKAFENLYERRIRIDQITVAQELDKMGCLADCGGAAYLSHMVSIVPTSMDAEYYADIIRSLYINRQIIKLGIEIQNEAQKQESDTNKVIDSISEMLRKLKQDNVIIDELITPEKASDILLNMVVEYTNPDDPIKWGYYDLDDITGGVFPELTIIGARPSVGKTELMVNITEKMKTKKILFASTEMAVRGLLERKIARRLKVSVLDIRKGKLNDKQLSEISTLSGEVSEQPVYYLPPGSTSRDIYNMVERMVETTGIDVVFVDYLQILKDCWETSRESKYARVGQACKVLKGIVNDFNIPVICASQLNREIESRSEDSKKPRLSDLRESGDIEQDADNVFLLWRDEVREPDVLEIKIAKGRQIGTFPYIRLKWLSDKRIYVNYESRFDYE